MADVQLENGFTKLAHEILENMALIKLSPTQYRLIFIIWRQTFGFNRKEHDLSLTFLSEATGCDKRQIQRELKSLEDRRIIYQKIKNGSYRIIGFNKDHDEWVGKSTIGETVNGEEMTIGEIDNGGRIKGGGTTIDDSTNGEAINGKPTIGETINTAIGETVNATIGETVNQINIYKDNFKDNVVVVEKDSPKHNLSELPNHPTTVKNVFNQEGIPTSRQGTVPAISEVSADLTREKISRSEYIEAVTTKYVSRRGTGMVLSARDDKAMNQLISSQIPLRTVLEGIDKAFDEYVPEHTQDRINSLQYCVPIIFGLHTKKTKQAENIIPFIRDDRKASLKIDSLPESVKAPSVEMNVQGYNPAEDAELQELFSQLKS